MLWRGWGTLFVVRCRCEPKLSNPQLKGTLVRIRNGGFQHQAFFLWVANHSVTLSAVPHVTVCQNSPP